LIDKNYPDFVNEIVAQYVPEDVEPNVIFPDPWRFGYVQGTDWVEQPIPDEAADKIDSLFALQVEGWKFCQRCRRWFRPITDYAKKHPSGDVNGKLACWPCYDGFFDNCWGPSESEFEYWSGLGRRGR